IAQRRVLLGEHLSPGSQNATRLWHVRGKLDIPRLLAALREVVRNYSILSRTFREHAGDWTPIDGSDDASIECVSLPAGQRAPSAWMALAREFGERPFDLAAPPLVRAVSSLTGRGESWLLLVAHHALVDGPSLAVVLDAWA